LFWSVSWGGDIGCFVTATLAVLSAIKIPKISETFFFLSTLFAAAAADGWTLMRLEFQELNTQE
jgi:hypothetical protein